MSPPAHDRAAILAALRLAKVTQAEIARRCGAKAALVWQVIDGRRPTPRIQEAIADAVGRPVDELFPRRQAGSEEAAA